MHGMKSSPHSRSVNLRIGATAEGLRTSPSSLTRSSERCFTKLMQQPECQLGVLTAYKAYLETLLLYNVLAGGLGAPIEGYVGSPKVAPYQWPRSR